MFRSDIEIKITFVMSKNTSINYSKSVKKMMSELKLGKELAF